MTVPHMDWLTADEIERLEYERRHLRDTDSLSPEEVECIAIKRVFGSVKAMVNIQYGRIPRGSENERKLSMSSLYGTFDPTVIELAREEYKKATKEYSEALVAMTKTIMPWDEYVKARAAWIKKSRQEFLVITKQENERLKSAYPYSLKPVSTDPKPRYKWIYGRKSLTPVSPDTDSPDPLPPNPYTLPLQIIIGFNIVLSVLSIAYAIVKVISHFSS